MPPQQPIEMILTRQWASYLALPVWLMSASGQLLYYNEAAEPLLGRPFEEEDLLSTEGLAVEFEATDLDGRPLEDAEIPITAALDSARPVHRRLRIRGRDQQSRLLDVTAFPVIGQTGKLLGGVALFWEPES